MNKLTKAILTYTLPVLAGAYSLYEVESHGITSVYTEQARDKAKVLRAMGDNGDANFFIWKGYLQRGFADCVAFGFPAGLLGLLFKKARDVSVIRH
jgi:hypothetical protein